MAATSVARTAQPTPSELAQQILDHKGPQYTFSFTPFLRKTYGHGLAPNRPICKAFLAGHCPSGTDCPDRHVTPSASAANNASYNSLVCKHWLRALCKKGESCEFLHEYNLRKMPECNFFVRNGYCSNGDECLYLHIDPQSKLPPCPHYDRGFCPLGPTCAKKHVRRQLCPYYMAGFCPDGKNCKEGAHARWEKNLEKPQPKTEKTEEELLQQQQAAARQRYEDYGGDDGGGRDGGGGGGGGGWRDRDDKGGDRGFRGGRGGRGGWRGRGDKRFGRGRGHH
ncbi:3' processing complex [Apiospora aurea]|uniref:mRNA 3'-end-processing protein n=1 Tax=Apiospora aurea TaxID=335848 RepID=A0ABR1QPH2_9PEZI